MYAKPWHVLKGYHHRFWFTIRDLRQGIRDWLLEFRLPRILFALVRGVRTAACWLVNISDRWLLWAGEAISFPHPPLLYEVVHRGGEGRRRSKKVWWQVFMLIVALALLGAQHWWLRIATDLLDLGRSLLGTWIVGGETNPDNSERVLPALFSYGRELFSHWLELLVGAVVLAVTVWLCNSLAPVAKESPDSDGQSASVGPETPNHHWSEAPSSWSRLLTFVPAVGVSVLGLMVVAGVMFDGSGMVGWLVVVLASVLAIYVVWAGTVALQADWARGWMTAIALLGLVMLAMQKVATYPIQVPTSHSPDAWEMLAMEVAPAIPQLILGGAIVLAGLVAGIAAPKTVERFRYHWMVGACGLAVAVYAIWAMGLLYVPGFVRNYVPDFVRNLDWWRGPWRTCVPSDGQPAPACPSWWRWRPRAEESLLGWGGSWGALGVMLVFWAVVSAWARTATEQMVRIRVAEALVISLTLLALVTVGDWGEWSDLIWVLVAAFVLGTLFHGLLGWFVLLMKSWGLRLFWFGSREFLWDWVISLLVVMVVVGATAWFIARPWFLDKELFISLNPMLLALLTGGMVLTSVVFANLATYRRPQQTNWVRARIDSTFGWLLALLVAMFAIVGVGAAVRLPRDVSELAPYAGIAVLVAMAWFDKPRHWFAGILATGIVVSLVLGIIEVIKVGVSDKCQPPPVPRAKECSDIFDLAEHREVCEVALGMIDKLLEKASGTCNGSELGNAFVGGILDYLKVTKFEGIVYPQLAALLFVGWKTVDLGTWIVQKVIRKGERWLREDHVDRLLGILAEQSPPIRLTVSQEGKLREMALAKLPPLERAREAKSEADFAQRAGLANGKK